MSESKSLNVKDLQILQSALVDLYSDAGQATLSERTLEFAKKIIPASVISFDSWDANGGSPRHRWNNLTILPTVEQFETFAKYVHENPVYIEVVVKKRLDPVILTDFIPIEEFVETNVYREFYSFTEAKYQMAITLWISSDLMMTCIFCDGQRDFSERDRLMLSAAAPHLINAVRNASDFDYLTSALEVKYSGVISTDGDGKIQFVSEFVSRIWNKYFEREINGTDFLPDELMSWIRSSNLSETKDDSAIQPFKVKNAYGELSVRPIINNRHLEKTFLFEEKRPITVKSLGLLPLTKRETEVLFWMAQGKSDADIAVLCNISRHTVHKHAQNIYIKLGVETRTAAMLRALEVL